MIEVELSVDLSRCPPDDGGEDDWIVCPISELDDTMQEHFPGFDIPEMDPDDIYPVIAFSGGVFKPKLAKK